MKKYIGTKIVTATPPVALTRLLAVFAAITPIAVLAPVAALAPVRHFACARIDVELDPLTVGVGSSRLIVPMFAFDLFNVPVASLFQPGQNFGK